MKAIKCQPYLIRELEKIAFYIRKRRKTAMERTIGMILLLGALLALCCGAAMAEPWAGSGTEADPWQITSAADLVALREYIAAGQNTTQGKYFKQTQNISLSSACSQGASDWTPIGSDDNGQYFSGTYDGSGHTSFNRKQL